MKQTCFPIQTCELPVGRGPYVVPVQGHGLFICATEILQTAGRVAVRTEWNDCSMLEFFLAILGFPPSPLL